MGVAATICHLRRRAGLSDPSRNLSDEKWAEFLAWVETREEEEGYFSKLATRQALHAILYGDRDLSIPKKFASIVARLRRDPYALTVIAEKIAGCDLAWTLTRESAEISWLEANAS